MKHLYLIYLIFFLAIFSSCRKDDSTFTPSTGSGSGSDSYFPLTKGTTRTYKATSSGNIATSVETVTGESKTYDGDKYLESVTKYDNSDVSLKSYTLVKDGVYINRGTSLINGFEVFFEYLNTNKAVGEKWTKEVSPTGMINGVPARIIGTMREKNISKVVNGKTYTNVIHTTMELQYKYMNDFETSGTYEFYAAKGIGTILVESTISMFGFEMTSKTELMSYTIK